MSHRIDTVDDLAAAVERLVALEPRFAPVLAATGLPPLRRRPGGFDGLVSIVISQQLSTASAGAIWTRLAAAYDPLAPNTIRRARASRLTKIGLSAAKIRTLKAIAGAIDSQALDLARLAELSADDAHSALTAVHGIGPWTADIYLLTCLGHADAWPAGDLALQEGARLAFALDARPSAKAMIGTGRAVAALARGGGAAVVDLLSRPQAARRRRRSIRHEKRQEWRAPWPLSSTQSATGAALGQARAAWSCSCMATAPTATTSSISAAPGTICCRTPPLPPRMRQIPAPRRRWGGNGFR